MANDDNPTAAEAALAEAIEGYVKRAIDQRIAELEARHLPAVAASTEAAQAALDAVATINATKDGGDAEALKSFERRISRIADHCAALESRLKRVERGT